MINYTIFLIDREISYWVQYLLHNPMVPFDYFKKYVCYTCIRNVQLKVKRYLNVSPIEIRNIGLLNFTLNNLYVQQELNFTEIAHRLGFYDQAHFNHFFKKHTNHSPREFLLLNQNVVKTTLNPEFKF